MKQGFTLIELMIVVLIIGILSAIAMPKYTQAIEKSRVSEALTMLNAIQKGVDIWLMENGYPNSAVELVGLSSAGDKQAKQLIIDAENALNCTGDRCAGKFFTYDAWCWSTGCNITAISTTKAEYALYLEKRGRKWTKTYCYSNDLGRAICDSLSGQGWTMDDDDC